MLRGGLTRFCAPTYSTHSKSLFNTKL